MLHWPDKLVTCAAGHPLARHGACGLRCFCLLSIGTLLACIAAGLCTCVLLSPSAI